ncbi:stearoyl-CoA desaturase-like protein [Leptotrombidium deliense]|uniref:Stearoyl-CoA desaturase-like protein n=1 Tax=Leptotrombidium deliense TaxID=299467 RepID=A0A443SLD8_9ACAR|nr:stearoyl-CoA desaturase-like protein [Leptotrombidium deliense]
MPPSVKEAFKITETSGATTFFDERKICDRHVNATSCDQNCINDEKVNNYEQEKQQLTTNVNNHISKNVTKSVDKNNNTFIFVKEGEWCVVWRNVVIFAILHALHFYGIYLLFSERRFGAWIISWWWGLWGGLGITAGAHRLWSHRSYKARLPLRIFYMFGQCIAGQNDLYTWCRDHRVHHKFSETDADPHNALRGYFFAHMGWLLMKKHPEVTRKGKEVELNDLLADPVIRFQKRFYVLLYFLFAFIIPTALPVYLWGETWWYSMFATGITRYCTSLHCTWFVNSTAHMFGDRPFNLNINPRENVWVSLGAFGEGYHNYHHTFPYDYATSELPIGFNISKLFIDFMESIGQAYDLKRVSRKLIEQRKEKVAHSSDHHH